MIRFNSVKQEHIHFLPLSKATKERFETPVLQQLDWLKNTPVREFIFEFNTDSGYMEKWHQDPDVDELIMYVLDMFHQPDLTNLVIVPSPSNEDEWRYDLYIRMYIESKALHLFSFQEILSFYTNPSPKLFITTGEKMGPYPVYEEISKQKVTEECVLMNYLGPTGYIQRCLDVIEFQKMGFPK